MLLGMRIAVVLPAYNAASTLQKTIEAIPENIVDHRILVDDASGDATAELAHAAGIETIIHPENRGYGGNQKTCYAAALATDADIIVMLHPDYQYEPKLLPALAAVLASGEYDIALGSRILDGQARRGGMPLWKYIANRLLTAFQNLLLGAKLSEYHTGYRAYTRSALERMPLQTFSDNFVFDNEVLVWALINRLRIGEVSCPARYFDDASSISLGPSIRYGLGVVGTTIKGVLVKAGMRSALVKGR
jgi:glycosyltransferase involved in cell wall biosynthesis